MLDMLVMQYAINDGIIMRQRHDEHDEYHIELGSHEDQEDDDAADEECQSSTSSSSSSCDNNNATNDNNILPRIQVYYTGHDEVD